MQKKQTCRKKQLSLMQRNIETHAETHNIHKFNKKPITNAENTTTGSNIQTIDNNYKHK